MSIKILNGDLIFKRLVIVDFGFHRKLKRRIEYKLKLLYTEVQTSYNLKSDFLYSSKNYFNDSVIYKYSFEYNEKRCKHF